MRIYIIGNDGITLCREPPATVNKERLPSPRARSCMPPGSAASGCWRCGTRSPGVEKQTKIGDRDALIDQLWSAIEALPEPEPQSDAKRPSKQDEVIAMLQRPEGATVDEVASATGWQRHTVRGVFSGTLKKKLGLTLCLGQRRARPIAHKGQLYPGQHPALIADETWTAVRDQLAANASDHQRKAKAAEPSVLAGLLVDAQGERLTPSHAVKKGRCYRYYVSAALITEAGTDRTQSWRLAAQETEDSVIRILVDALTSPAKLLEGLGTTGMPSEQVRKMLGRAGRLSAAMRGSPAERAKIVRELVEKVRIDEETIAIKVRRGALLGRDAPSGASDKPSDSTIELAAAVDFKRHGVETKLVLPGLAQQNHGSRCNPGILKRKFRPHGSDVVLWR